jgi:two-component system, NtrC family, sensor kinase
MTHDEPSKDLTRLATNLSHLSAGVGHHVINAFSTIVSNVEILRHTANSSAAIDPITLADLIVNEAMEASAVARRLIDYTRLTTHLDNQVVALDQFMAEVIRTERDLGRPGINWEINLAAVPSIVGHDLQLKAMASHLLENAYEAMPPQGGTITVSTGVDTRGWIVLEIRDTGKGMDSKTLEKAMEPFFSTKPGHFGVGLSIANGIWRRHKGTMAIHSVPGEGTSVRLCVEPAQE